MLSRTAESIYWMSRYVERAENVARFIDVNLHLMLDQPEYLENNDWEPLVITSGDEKDFYDRYSKATEENVIYFLTFDKKNPNSIISCLSLARENARNVQETISSEMWEHLNLVYIHVQKNSRKKKLDDLHGFYTEIKNASHLFVGLSETTMSHGEGWHFARVGRLLERADKTARILDVSYFNLKPKDNQADTPYDVILWGALLKSASALEMYRKQHHRIFHANVVDFLIFSPYFPRSLAYCINGAQESMGFIESGFEKKSEALLELEKLRKMLTISDLDSVMNDGVHDFIDIFQLDLNTVGERIFNSFFEIKQSSSQFQSSTSIQ